MQTSYLWCVPYCDIAKVLLHTFTTCHKYTHDRINRIDSPRQPSAADLHPHHRSTNPSNSPSRLLLTVSASASSLRTSRLAASFSIGNPRNRRTCPSSSSTRARSSPSAASCSTSCTIPAAEAGSGGLPAPLPVVVAGVREERRSSYSRSLVRRCLVWRVQSVVWRGSEAGVEKAGECRVERSVRSVVRCAVR